LATPKAGEDVGIKPKTNWVIVIFTIQANL